MPYIMHNIRPPKVVDIPLPDNIQVPEGGLHIPIELSMRILHALTSESCALSRVIRDLTDHCADIDTLVHLLSVSLPCFNDASTF